MKRSALFLLIGAVCLRAAEPPYRDTAVYAPREISWSTRGDVKKAEAVYSHPILPERAILVTTDGALQTEDGGKNWKPWPEAAKMGRIRAVAFDPKEIERFLIGGNGIWETTDNGKTFRQLATQAGGLASDSIADLIFYNGDPGGSTLLAVHGEGGAGMSRSRNGGKTWDIVNPDYNFRRLLGGDSGDFKRIFLFGSATNESDVQGLYMAVTPGEFVSELLRDTLLTDISFDPSESGAMVLATSDSGAYRIASSKSTVGQELEPLPLSGVPGWASLSVTWGPNADVVELCGYDPAKLGLVLSGDRFKTVQAFSDGVVVSPLVKEGAAVRPNSNGTIFYAVANGTLSVGRTDSVPRVAASPAVLQLAQDDPTFNDARNAFLAFAKTADGQFGEAALQLEATFGDLAAPYSKRRISVNASVPDKPTGVFVDLSRAGGAPNTPLFDDGKHDDGVAKDGVFGKTFVFDAKRPPNDWRPGVPGRIPLGISATYADGKRTGAVALVGIYTKIASTDVWNKNGTDVVADSEGGVSVRLAFNPPSTHAGAPLLRIEPRSGPWSISIEVPRKAVDITGFEALSFWIRASGPAPETLAIKFVDQPDFSEPITTPEINIVPDMIDRGAIGTEYRRVVVPLASLSDSGFQPSRLDKIVITGDAKAPTTLFLDNFRLNATRAELETP